MLTLRLEISGNLEELCQIDTISNYEYPNDDVDIVIQELCEILEKTGIVQFRVGGFGQDIWPVDVAVDLASILEQIPEVIYSISEGNYPFFLDFYEQGIQRRLAFEKEGGSIKISCYSGTSWTPCPSFILVSDKDILSQFLTLKNSFLQAVKIVCPKLSGSDLFTTW